MRRALVPVLSFALLVVACGKESDPYAPKGDPAPKATPPPPGAAPTSTPTPGMVQDPAPSSWSGTVVAAGISIVMEGTHQLLDGKKLVVYLRSTKVKLSEFEGKSVILSGPSSPTVEGKQTIVDVETITEVR